MDSRLETNFRYALGVVSVLFITLGVLDWNSVFKPFFAALGAFGGAYLAVLVAELLGRSAEERATKVVGDELIDRIAQANAEVINQSLPDHLQNVPDQFGKSIYLYYVSGDARNPRYWQMVRVDIRLMIASDTWLGQATLKDSEGRPVNYRIEIIQLNDMLVIGITREKRERRLERSSICVFDGVNPEQICFGLLSHHDWVGKVRVDPVIFKPVPVRFEDSSQPDQTQRFDNEDHIKQLDDLFCRNLETLGTFDKILLPAIMTARTGDCVSADTELRR